MEFFTKLLKMNHSSRSPSPAPGPSAMHQNEESVSEESSQTKERPKQGHDRKNKADHFYHNVGNLLRPTNESKTTENSQSNTFYHKGELSPRQLSPSMSSKSNRYNTPERASCDEKRVTPQNDRVVSFQRRTLSPSPPTMPESGYMRRLEDSPNFISHEDTIKSYSSDVGNDIDALNAVKSNIEVLAYLKKSELTERHRETNEKYSNFITNSFNYQKILEDRNVKPTNFEPENDETCKVDIRRDGFDKDAKVNGPRVPQTPIQSAPVSETIKSVDFIPEGSRISKENLLENDDKTGNEVTSSDFTSKKVEETFSLPNLHQTNKNCNPKSLEINQTEYDNLFKNLNERYASEHSSHTSNLSRKANKLVRQTAQTIDWSQDPNNQKDSSFGKISENECEDNKSLFNSFDIMKDQIVEVSSASNSLILTDRRNSTKQSSLYIDKRFESNLSSPGPTSLLTNDEKATSEILVQDCHLAQISNRMTSPTSNIGCRDNANDPIHSPKPLEVNDKDCLDDPEEQAKVTVEKSQATHVIEMTEEKPADKAIEPKNLLENHKDLLPEREWVNVFQNSKNNTEYSKTFNERPSTSSNIETPHPLNVKEGSTRLKEKTSKFEQWLGNAPTTSVMNIYMRGEVGDTVKIEKIGDLYISDSSRKSSAKSLEEELEGFSDCESKENDTDIESDSLERVDDGSGSDSENEYDFDIEFVDDIEERLCSGEDAPTVEENVREKIEKLLNSSNRDNAVIPVHESDINIHAPPDYLTVQRPRNKKRSLRIRLSPVIELLEESLSPSILFDISDMPQMSDLDISQENSEQLEKIYGRENVQTSREEICELRKDDESAKTNVTYLDKAKNNSHKSKSTNSADKSPSCTSAKDSQIQIMIYPASSSPENQILTTEVLEFEKSDSSVTRNSYNAEETLTNDENRIEITIGAVETRDGVTKPADMKLLEESSAETEVMKNLCSTLLTGSDETETAEELSLPNVLVSEVMVKNVRRDLDSAANMNTTNRCELASCEFKKDHRSVSCVQEEISESEGLISQSSQDSQSFKKICVQTSNSKSLNYKDSMNIHKDGDPIYLQVNELEIKDTPTFGLNDNSGNISETSELTVDPENKLLHTSEVNEHLEIGSDASKQTHQKHQSVAKNSGPMSLKELCEATIYDDFENRNVDSISLGDNEISVCSNLEDYKLSSILCIDSFDADMDESSLQDEEKECLASSHSFMTAPNPQTIHNEYSSADSDRDESFAMTSSSLSKENTRPTTQIPDILKSNTNVNKNYNEITDEQGENELHTADPRSDGTIQLTSEEVLFHDMNKIRAVQQESKASGFFNMSSENSKSLVPMKFLPEKSNEPVKLDVRWRQEEFPDNFILLKILENRNMRIDGSSPKLNIPLMITSAQLERTPGINLDVTVNFQNESSFHLSEIPADVRTSDLTHEALYLPQTQVSSDTNIIDSSDSSIEVLRHTSTKTTPQADFPQKLENTDELRFRVTDTDYNTMAKEDIQKVLRSKEAEILVLKEDNKQMQEELRELAKSKRNMEELLVQRDNQNIPMISVHSRPAVDTTSELKTVVREYEEIIAGLMEIVERDRSEFDKERQNLQKEVTELISHLNSLELAFNDIHLKYEKSKIVITGFKSNEELLKQCISDMEMVIVNHEKRYNSLKEHATTELRRANEELDSTKKSYEIKLSTYNDLLKKCETQLKSLQEIINMKMEENASLMKICDDLICKVSDVNQ